MKNVAFAGALILHTALVSQAFAAPEEMPLEEPTAPSGITYQPQQKAAPAAKVGELEVRINGIANGKPIDPRFAYCAPDGKGATKEGGNISPGINWSGAPAGTKSYVLISVDTDVPASFESANQPGKEIDVKFPRKNFYHWVLADIPANVTGLLEGKASSGITPGGKPVGKTGYGINGRNDYGLVYQGSFGGYDGPCPPWNDLRLHHYHFIVYALDIPSLGLPNPITGPKAEASMEGHILARGEVVGTYSNNVRWIPELSAQLKAQKLLESQDDAKKNIDASRKIKEIEHMKDIHPLKAPDKKEEKKEVTPGDLIK